MFVPHCEDTGSGLDRNEDSFGPNLNTTCKINENLSHVDPHYLGSDPQNKCVLVTIKVWQGLFENNKFHMKELEKSFKWYHHISILV